jgi:hypothetical protein
MNCQQVLLSVALCALFTAPTIGCKKRQAPSPSGEGGAVEASGAISTPVIADPPKNLPPNTLPLPRPATKAWSERTRPEKLVQMDFWLNQHQFGDASQKGKTVGEIRAASLNPAEQKELEDTRKRFGYAPLGQ